MAVIWRPYSVPLFLAHFPLPVHVQMSVPSKIYGNYIVAVSVREYESYSGRTLVKKELNAGYFYSEKMARRLTFLGHEGESLWIQADANHNFEDCPLPTLLVYRQIRGSLHMSPLSFEDGGGHLTDREAIFNISDQRKVNLVFPKDGERLKIRFCDFLESPIDDMTTIKLIWDIECTMVSTDLPPENYVAEETETQETENRNPAPGKLVDKFGKRVQCCRGCGRPRKGHRGKLGPSCTTGGLN